jgi:acyl transferase domain-containing protein
MAQRTLIASALRRAKVKATEVSYMEAHGTGTPLGDPIEFRAFSSVLGADRQKDNPLWIGSAKTNIGHAEAAAGVAGMIKVALAMKHGVIPPHLHFTSINPNIDLAESHAQIPMRLETWTHKRKIAGVSSFGMLGTNSHVVMEAPDSAAAGGPANRYAPASQETVARVLTISAKTTSSLETLLTSYISELGRDESMIDWSGLCNTAARRRAHLAERVAVVAKSKLQAATRLTEFLKNGVAPGVARGRVRHGDRRKIAFLFSGQGSQYIGMGADLYEKSLVFRTYFDRVNEMIRSLLDIDLTKLLLNSSRDVFERGDTKVLQPLIYAVEIGLAEVWKALGIRPTVVIGHSLGEYAAAVTAGVLSVEDGARIVARRSQIMSDIHGNAGMLSTDLSRADADEICRLWPMIDLSAENGSRSHVLSGPTEKLTELEAELKSRGIRAKRLSVSHAFHSRQMDGVLAQFSAGIQSIQFAAPKIRFLSTVTGDRADQSIICNTKYWTDHIRKPVLFGPAIQRTKDEGIDTLIEIGPGEALITMGRLNRPGDGLVWLGSILSGKPDSERILQSIAELHVSGVQCNWEQVVGLGGGETAEVPGSLPLYPFTKKVFSNVWAGRAAGESDVLRSASSEVQNSASAPNQVPESSVNSLESGIRAIISDLLGLEDPAALDASNEFGQMGLDSVMAIKARDRISRLMSGSKELPQTLVFEYPTLERLLAHLAPGSGQQAERESTKEQIENRWVKVPRRRPEAKLRIYCMHYATGSTNMYRNWPDLIHPEVEVRPIQLPGRWERLREPLFSESGPLVDALFKAIAPELDQIPYALFGYSLGGVLSWELCRRVRKAGLPLPVHLFPAASMPPQMIFNTETHSAPEGTLLRAVDKILGGVPHQLVQEAAGNVTFPIIRNDFAVFDNYQYEPQEPFDFPITAFGGLQDVLVTPKFLEFWSTHTRGRYSERYFHGGHFFFLTEESKIISELNLILDDGLRKGATR